MKIVIVLSLCLVLSLSSCDDSLTATGDGVRIENTSVIVEVDDIRLQLEPNMILRQVVVRTTVTNNRDRDLIPATVLELEAGVAILNLKKQNGDLLYQKYYDSDWFRRSDALLGGFGVDRIRVGQTVSQASVIPFWAIPEYPFRGQVEFVLYLREVNNVSTVFRIRALTEIVIE